MKTLDLNELLQNHPYPGRGIVLGRSADDKKAVIAYFIMGRSENSRNRVFETTEDGYTHFPDGTSVNYEHATDTVEYDPNAPLGSEANPLPADPQVPEPGYEDLPDTDLSDTNLEKTESTWNEMHVMEYFDITNADLKTTLEEFGVKQKMAPTKIPSAYSIPEIQITKDYLFDQVTFVGTYTKPTDPNGPIILVLIEVPLNGSGGGIEKDDRPVIQYEKPNATWYIMHCIRSRTILMQESSSLCQEHRLM